MVSSNFYLHLELIKSALMWYLQNVQEKSKP